MENSSLWETTPDSQRDVSLVDNWNQEINEIMEVDIKMNTEEIDMEVPEEVMRESTDENTQELAEEIWVYTDYRAPLVGYSENTIIFFAASWCPSCQAADRNLATADIPSWVTILKADFDSEIDLRQKYGVVAQHTFVSIDSKGNQIRKWVGGTSIDDIIEKL